MRSSGATVGCFSPIGAVAARSSSRRQAHGRQRHERKGNARALNGMQRLATACDSLCNSMQWHTQRHARGCVGMHRSGLFMSFVTLKLAVNTKLEKGGLVVLLQRSLYCDGNSTQATWHKRTLRAKSIEATSDFAWRNFLKVLS